MTSKILIFDKLVDLPRYLAYRLQPTKSLRHNNYLQRIITHRLLGL